MSISTWKHDGFEISTDLARVDKDWLLGTLAKTYWASGNTPETLWTSQENSRVYGLYGADGGQVGFARVVTDMARFAWLSDVLVDPKLQGQGLGKWLMDVVTGDPALAKINRWMLGTNDAHGLYEQYGFVRIVGLEADKVMVLRREKS